MTGTQLDQLTAHINEIASRQRLLTELALTIGELHTKSEHIREATQQLDAEVTNLEAQSCTSGSNLSLSDEGEQVIVKSEEMEKEVMALLSRVESLSSRLSGE